MLYFTSDQHYGHRNIIAHSQRPFADIEEMHRELIGRHNARVLPMDSVWHLGDFSLDDKPVRDVLPLLRGQHRLVVGNHDDPHPCHRKHEAATRRYLRLGFEIVVESAEIDVDGLGRVLLTHMPRSGGPDARYPEYRPDAWRGPIFHGHVHDAWKVRRHAAGVEVNVGVDVWGFVPVPVGELVAAARPEAP